MSTVMETPREQVHGRRTALSAGLVAGVVIAAAVAALIAQNTDGVTVRWLMFDGQQPMWLLLVLTAIAGAVIAKALGFAWHRRDHR